MDIREKMVELLHNCPHLDTIKGYKGRDCTFEQGADWLVARGVTVQEWVSVKDMLPKNEKPVLTFVGYEESMIGFITVSSYFCFEPKPHWQWDGALNDEQKTLFWMPLPQPPKGE